MSKSFIKLVLTIYLITILSLFLGLPSEEDGPPTLYKLLIIEGIFIFALVVSYEGSKFWLVLMSGIIVIAGAYGASWYMYSNIDSSKISKVLIIMIAVPSIAGYFYYKGYQKGQVQNEDTSERD